MLPQLQEQLLSELASEGVDMSAAAGVEDDSLSLEEGQEVAETGYVDEQGQLRRPWCPETRVLEHREMVRGQSGQGRGGLAGQGRGGGRLLYKCTTEALQSICIVALCEDRVSARCIAPCSKTVVPIKCKTAISFLSLRDSLH
jgi:hypothetical protein